jgi:hypothetical protein
LLLKRPGKLRGAFAEMRHSIAFIPFELWLAQLIS